MRMGTFLLGGIAGAAAVMYLSKRNFSVMAVMPQLTQGLKNTMQSSRDIGGSTSKSSGSGTDSAADLDKVAEMASKDPSVMGEVNKIMEENGQNSVKH
ncbi:hypothetical protein [Marinicrinis lubricantis]|uniref:YtxH-like protein n=1 Tax=Marinicrinis lubricantis TaxID=2086470 RepID=A0ABW1ISR1_9BACL